MLVGLQGRKMLSNLSYQERYLLFCIIAEYGNSASFGKREGGTIGLAKRFCANHKYMNGLLTGLHEKGLIERESGFYEGRGRAPYRYALTPELLDEVKRSKCLFGGAVNPEKFQTVYQLCNSYKYAGKVSNEQILVRWLMINLLVLTKTGVWFDSTDFSALKRVLGGQLSGRRISNTLEKLQRLGAISYSDDKETFSVVGKRAIFIDGWHECLKHKSQGRSKIEAIHQPSILDVLGTRGVSKFDVDYIYPFMNVEPRTHRLFPSAFKSWGGHRVNAKNQFISDIEAYYGVSQMENDLALISGGYQANNPTASKTLVKYNVKQAITRYKKNLYRVNAKAIHAQLSYLASIILSEHSELFVQCAVVFERRKANTDKLKVNQEIKSVYETLLSNKNIKREMAFDNLLPKALVAQVDLSSIDSMVFDWDCLSEDEQQELAANEPVNFVRGYILLLLYNAFCLARMHFQWLTKAGSYHPNRFVYHICFHSWNPKLLQSQDSHICASVYAESRSKGIWDKDELHVFSHKEFDFYHSKSRLF